MKKRFAEKSAVILSILSAFLFILIFNASASDDTFGDLNNDGKTDKNDVIMLQHYLTKRNSGGIDLAKADIDGNGKINVFDFIYLKRYLLYGTYPENHKTTTATTASSITTVTTTTSVTVSTEPVEKVYARNILDAVNEERAKVGAKPLVLNEKLCELAMIRAQEASEYFSHTRPDGSKWSSILIDEGISFHYIGENIAAGSSTPAGTMNQWINSPGHYENITRSNFEELGVGYVYVPGSQYRYYWVQIFLEN